jgi:hypothetical protein
LYTTNLTYPLFHISRMAHMKTADPIFYGRWSETSSSEEHNQQHHDEKKRRNFPCLQAHLLSVINKMHALLERQRVLNYTDALVLRQCMTHPPTVHDTLASSWLTISHVPRYPLN